MPVLYAAKLRAWFCALVALCVVLTCVTLDWEARGQAEFASDRPHVVQSIRSLSGRELEQFLSSFHYEAHTWRLSDSDIDDVIQELSRIASEDPYQREFRTKGLPKPGSPPQMIFPNRKEAEDAIRIMRIRKAANPLREQPIARRVRDAIDVVEGRKLNEFDGAHYWFREELIAIGKDAVPILLDHLPADPRFDDMYIHILGRIGDVRAIEAMIEAMKRLPAESFTSRCEAMQSLSKLDTGRVIDFLINELQNDAVTNCNRCITLQQQLPPPESMQTPSNKESNEPCIFEVYPIRQCAARTLNLLTKRNWEPVFEEDFKTWAAWRDCTDRSVFDPNLLARTDEELAELGEKLIHREMCASRPGANYRGSEGRNSGIAIIGEHLRPLGSHATSVVLNEYKSRIGLICSDEGRVELRKWAATILNAIGTPDARATVESLLQN